MTPLFFNKPQFGAVACLVAMAFFAGWPFWKWLKFKPVSEAVQQRTSALVEKNAQLKPAWDVAMEDGVLTLPEAKIIVESAGEKLESDK